MKNGKASFANQFRELFPTILRLPKERKLWILRKHIYGGIPPTDPRILAMTDEQIDMEYAHVQYDKKMKESNGKDFEDEEFDDYDKETEDDDSMLPDEADSLDADATSEVQYVPKNETKHVPEDWEDVEIDDLDDPKEDWEK
jgi:hypothetical protein